MTGEESVVTLLDDTIASLSILDLERLITIEQKMLLIAKSGMTNVAIASLLERQQVLGRVLEATQSNLESLTQLHQRYGTSQWVR